MKTRSCILAVLVLLGASGAIAQAPGPLRQYIMVLRAVSSSDESAAH